MWPDFGLTGHPGLAAWTAAPWRIAAVRGGRRKNLGRRVRVTAYQKTLLTRSTLCGSSGFPITATQLDLGAANWNSPKRSLANSPNRPQAAGRRYISISRGGTRRDSLEWPVFGEELRILAALSRSVAGIRERPV